MAPSKTAAWAERHDVALGLPTSPTREISRGWNEHVSVSGVIPNQRAVQPPSMETAAPVNCAAASLHKNTARSPSCSTVTNSFVG